MTFHCIDLLAKEEYHFPRLPTDTDELTVFRVGHEVWGPCMRLGANALDRQVFVYVVRGGGCFRTTAGTIELGGGMALCYGGAGSFDLSTGGREMEVYIVPCGGRNAFTLFGDVLGTNQGVWQLARPFEILELLEKLFAEAGQHRRYAHDICAHYLQIIIRKVAADRIRPGSRASRTLESFNSCRDYITVNFSRLHGIGEVAAACGLTQAYLTRLFRRYENMSPYEYLIRLKLNRATQLLLTTPLAIHEIAEELGYADPYTFSRAFKRVLGEAPARYRAKRSSFHA